MRQVIALGATIAVSTAAGILSDYVCLAQDAPIELRQFARELARAGIPAGVIAPESMFKASAVVFSDGHGRTETTGQLEAAISRFNAADTRLRAAGEAGVVRVRTIDEPTWVRDALARTVYLEQASVSLFEAVFVKARGLLSGRAGQGIAGSMLSNGSEPCPLSHQVRLGGERSVSGTLDVIVRQVRGAAWVVTYDPELPYASLTLGILCADGSYSRVSAF